LGPPTLAALAGAAKLFALTERALGGDTTAGGGGEGVPFPALAIGGAPPDAPLGLADGAAGRRDADGGAAAGAPGGAVAADAGAAAAAAATAIAPHPSDGDASADYSVPSAAAISPNLPAHVCDAQDWRINLTAHLSAADWAAVTRGLAAGVVAAEAFLRHPTPADLHALIGDAARSHVEAWKVSARRCAAMAAGYLAAPTGVATLEARLVKTASSGSFGFQGPGSHLIGLVQQFWLSIGGCGGRQWGWKTTHLLPPRPQFFLRKWMWANQRMTPTQQARCP